jgi:hypothetical protein
MCSLAVYVAPRVLLWPANGPLTGFRVLLPGRPDWILPLLFPLSPGHPRLDLPVATLLLVVPVLRSVLRLLRAPLYPMSVLPQRAAAPLLVIYRDALFARRCRYPTHVALGHVSDYSPFVPPVVPLRVGPGVGVRVLLCGGLLVMLLAGGELHQPTGVGPRGAAGAAEAANGGGHRATFGGGGIAVAGAYAIAGASFRPAAIALTSGCDEYNHATIHYRTLYMYSLLISIRDFPSDGRSTWVRRYCNISKGSDAYCTTSNSRYVKVRTLNLTSQMTRLSEVSNAK